MRARIPSTETMPISAVKSRLNSLVNEIYRNETRILVEKSGIPVAGIVPIADMQRLARLDEFAEAYARGGVEEVQREAGGVGGGEKLSVGQGEVGDGEAGLVVTHDGAGDELEVDRGDGNEGEADGAVAGSVRNTVTVRAIRVFRATPVPAGATSSSGRRTRPAP